ncbi:flagellar assembly protein FliW [Chengkuizengella axinellae]|uniref:Flagellar assembly factor FliW n=1 Tax=Chengkuizengella axinellae TaxID=3064388 RepID=A0ABT9J2S3_9BACL|nr:flagellar assembly protein FliW [Chengkuizengella sp. 2205SS18-9]MDP5275885.1 flagellar assembly protein FliW [Chengkuizengella sp. 2205SS18-9]
MKIKTKHFGEIDIDESKIIKLTQGLLGFDDVKEYALIQLDQEIPLTYMQSIEDQNINFIILNPFQFFKDYNVELSQDVQDELEIKEPSEVAIWSLATIQENLEDATCNLIAPLVFNIRTKLGKQIVLHNTDYTTKHKFVPQTEEVEGG